MSRLHIKHILTAQKYEAEDLLRRLQHGEDFAVLAQKYSQCSSGSQGGDLGEVPLKKLDETFREAAESLKKGELSSVVKTRFGYHLILRC